ncbi:1242_t:CDS:2, partial [Acaulospora colombiana]
PDYDEDPHPTTHSPEELHTEVPLATPLETPLASLLRAIQISKFVKENRLEPNLGSPEANEFLELNGASQVQVDSTLRGRSIYFLFIEDKQKKCRVCGGTKSSATRAVECMRDVLNVVTGKVKCGVEIPSPLNANYIETCCAYLLKLEPDLDEKPAVILAKPMK